MPLLPKKVSDPWIMRSLKFIWVAVLFIYRSFNSIWVAQKKTEKRCPSQKPARPSHCSSVPCPFFIAFLAGNKDRCQNLQVMSRNFSFSKCSLRLNFFRAYSCF